MQAGNNLVFAIFASKKEFAAAVFMAKVRSEQAVFGLKECPRK
jgi:hypothetical protein